MRGLNQEIKFRCQYCGHTSYSVEIVLRRAKQYMVVGLIKIDQLLKGIFEKIGMKGYVPYEESVGWIDIKEDDA